MLQKSNSKKEESKVEVPIHQQLVVPPENMKRFQNDLGLNTLEPLILEHMRQSIALGLKQVRPFPPHMKRTCLVGGGPSLKDTFGDLRQKYFEGQKIVAMNGSYNWLLERNIKPSAMVMVDCRPNNAKFIGPDVPGCKWFIASQCHPEIFEKVKGRDVYIIHVAGTERQKKVLDKYYNKQYYGVIGGSTVMLRTIGLMRMLGNKYMNIYGFDGCYLNEEGHAYPQEENDSDEIQTVVCAGKEFRCANWHVSQAEDFLHFLKEYGNTYALNITGDGLMSYLLKTGANFYIETKENLNGGKRMDNL